MSTDPQVRNIHFPTLIAISVIAWALVNILHEIVGHAGASLAMGVPVNAVSTTTIYMVTDWDRLVAERGLNPVRLIVAAGTVVNIATGTVALLALRWRRVTNMATRYFLWLFAAFSMVIVMGNMVTNSLLGIGDVSEFLSGLNSANLWRLVIIVAGLLLAAMGYVLSLGLNLPSGQSQRTLLLAITGIPVLTLIVVQTLSLVRSPFATLPPETNHLLASVLAYIHFVLWVLVANLLPRVRKGNPTGSSADAFFLPRSDGWIALGIFVCLFFVLVLGPGMGSFAGDPRLG